MNASSSWPSQSRPTLAMASASALTDDLLDRILLRLPPDDPGGLARASLVCKPWRRVLADPAFRRRYRGFHRAPPLMGFLQSLRGGEGYRFLPTSAFRPADPGHPGWSVLDCRHGRALFWDAPNSQFVVWDPMADERRFVPEPPSISLGHHVNYSGAVLCAAQGCDHCGCQGSSFRVAILITNRTNGVTSARLYSSETGAWSEPTSVHHPHAYVQKRHSVLLGDALYFFTGGGYTIEYKLGTPPARLSVFNLPVAATGGLMSTEDGRLGFASLHNTILTLWSREICPKGVTRWAQRRVIDLKTLLPDDAFTTSHVGRTPCRCLVALADIVEGTDVVFVRTNASVYMVELKSWRARKVLGESYVMALFPYMSFCIPAMQVASAGEG